MKKKLWIIGIVLVVLFLFLIFYVSNEKIEEVRIKTPENIVQIQFNTMRIDKDDYPAQKFEKLLLDLESLRPVKVTDVQEKNSDDFLSILLLYEDGTKDKFYFFRKNEKWYAEIENRGIYDNAEFINEYISYEYEKEEDDDFYTAIPVDLELISIFSEVIKKQNLTDFEKEVLYSVNVVEKMGLTKEESLQRTENGFNERWKIFHYAKTNELFPNKKEQEKLVELYLDSLKSTENYMEIKKILNDGGLTIEEFATFNKNNLIERRIHDQISKIISKQYMTGKDEIEGKVYSNFQEYQAVYFKTQIIDKELNMEEYKQFQEELEKALKICRS